MLTFFTATVSRCSSPVPAFCTHDAPWIPTKHRWKPRNPKLWGTGKDTQSPMQLSWTSNDPSSTAYRLRAIMSKHTSSTSSIIWKPSSQPANIFWPNSTSTYYGCTRKTSPKSLYELIPASSRSTVISYCMCSGFKPYQYIPTANISQEIGVMSCRTCQGQKRMPQSAWSELNSPEAISDKHGTAQLLCIQ